MVLKFRDKNISSLDDIQKLTAKDLREILKSHVESAGGTNADLVLKYGVISPPKFNFRLVMFNSHFNFALYESTL